MKKTYMNPEMDIVNIKTSTLLAGSGGVNSGDEPGDEYNKNDATYAPYFDDDEEEDADW